MHFSSWINLRKAVTTLLLTAGLLLYGMSNLQAARSASVASGKNGIVVAGEKRAADIVTQMLEKGGNAADAATAALLALSVTRIGAFTFGGEASVLFYDAHQHKAHALWAQGAIDPLVGATFPLADAESAHALIESRRHVGKVVLEP